MDHLRVATCEVLEGTPADILEIVQQPDGVIAVYKGMLACRQPSTSTSVPLSTW